MDPENFPLPVETIIRNSFPEEADREIRICLLRMWHAAERVQWELNGFGAALSDFVRDPEPLYSGRVLLGGAKELTTKLVSLAAEIQKSHPDLIRLARERYASSIKSTVEERGA